MAQGDQSSSPVSSRASLRAAGWDCETPGTFRGRMPPEPAPSFSWLRPSTLLQSRNDTLANSFFDPTDGERERWIAQQRRLGFEPDRAIARWRGEDEVSFLVIGDTGEGDESQYASVPAIESLSAETSFMVICSDVIYPAGEVNDYPKKFFRPYRGYDRPIYATPGNHDWYDGLTGFMHVFCGAPPLPPKRIGLHRGVLPHLLWRRARGLDPQALAEGQALRAGSNQQPPEPQPGPYWALDVGSVRLVGIDTGITGQIDAEQGAWLKRVSNDGSDPAPKVLLTGKPLYVNGQRRPGRIVGERTTIDDIVRNPAHNYVAAIGGDIHNYQRYPVRQADGRTIEYLVSGAGGAFMHATHKIARVELKGVDEKSFRCYPLRGDSLALYSRLWDRRLARGHGLFEIEADRAASYMAKRISEPPARGGAPVDERTRFLAERIYPLSAERGFQRFFSEFFDWNDPPLFKSFLRVDVTATDLSITCLAATGCGEDEQRPPVEDRVTINLG